MNRILSRELTYALGEDLADHVSTAVRLEFATTNGAPYPQLILQAFAFTIKMKLDEYFEEGYINSQEDEAKILNEALTILQK